MPGSCSVTAPACATRQQLGDYVLAHGYVREDHVLDEELPLWVPIPALAEDPSLRWKRPWPTVTGLRGRP